MVDGSALGRQLGGLAELRAVGLPDVAGGRLARLPTAGGVFGASRTIGDGGLTLFTAVDSTRRDSKLNLDLAAGVLVNRLSTLERTSVRMQQLEGLRADILRQARAEVTTGIRDVQTALESEIRQITVSQTSLSQQVSLLADAQTQLSRQISLKADIATVNTLQTQTDALRRDVDLKADRATVDALTRSSAGLARFLEARTAPLLGRVGLAQYTGGFTNASTSIASITPSGASSSTTPAMRSSGRSSGMCRSR